MVQRDNIYSDATKLLLKRIRHYNNKCKKLSLDYYKFDTYKKQNIINLKKQITPNEWVYLITHNKGLKNIFKNEVE